LEDTTIDEDDKLLKKWGYKAELHRGFNAFMNFSFTFTSVAVISSITVTFGTGLITGGPVVLIWSWIGVSFFTILVGLSLAEICSTYPSAGSVYTWAGMMASP
jgi:amino acid transporter